MRQIIRGQPSVHGSGPTWLPAPCTSLPNTRPLHPLAVYHLQVVRLPRPANKTLMPRVAFAGRARRTTRSRYTAREERARVAKGRAWSGHTPCSNGRAQAAGDSVVESEASDWAADFGITVPVPQESKVEAESEVAEAINSVAGKIWYPSRPAPGDDEKFWSSRRQNQYRSSPDLNTRTGRPRIQIVLQAGPGTRSSPLLSLLNMSGGDRRGETSKAVAAC